MFADLKITSSPAKRDRDAFREAARWRGQCVDFYAQIEFLVGSALHEVWAQGISRPKQGAYTYRMKIAALRDIVEQQGSLSGLRQTLDDLHAACARRNLIVHASGNVGIGPEGGWVWTGWFIESDEERVDVVEALPQSAASKFEDELRRTVQRLRSHLRTWANKEAAVTE